MTLYREIPCKHGLTDTHFIDNHKSFNWAHPECPGGSHEEIIVDYEAAVYGFWDGEASGPPPNGDDLKRAKQAVDAALGITDT